MDTTLNNLQNNSLPTQHSEPQRWGEAQLPPLTLRELGEFRPADNRKVVRAMASAATRYDLRRQILLLVVVTLLCLAAYYFVSRFIATAVIVQGRSMLPTLQDGDRFILNRLSYWRQGPERGDLVVVKDPGHKDYAIKRIVALPRETLYFKAGDFMIDGKPLFEPYLASRTHTYLPDSREKMIVLGQDQYFVMGDNRGNSEDSRFYGAVRRSQIVGSILR